MKNTTLCSLVIWLCFLKVSAQHSNNDSITWSVDVDDVVITAQYAPTLKRQAVHNVRSIDKTEITQRGVLNLEQLLQQELNIRISQDLILGSSINLNGISGQNIQIMKDGIPIIGRVGDDIDLSQVNIQNLERVEIVDAPLSVNYGTNALGGTINLITKKTQLEDIEIDASAQYESIGRQNINTSIGWRPKQHIFFQLHGGMLSFDGLDSEADSLETQERSFQWNPKHQVFGGLAAKYYISEDHTIRYAVDVYSERIQNLGNIRRPQFKPYAFDDYYYTRRNDHSLHHSIRISPSLALETTAGHNFFKRKKNTYRHNFENSEQIALPNQQDTTLFHGMMLRSTLSSNFRHSKWNFQSGIDLRYDNAFGKRIRDELSNVENMSTIRDYAFFTSIKYRPTSKIILQPGLRVAYNSRFKAPLTPSINTKYEISDELILRASYARGFRSPSLKELFFYFVDSNHFILGNKDLKAETSDNYRLAFDCELKNTGIRYTASIAGFYNDIRDKIDLYQYISIDGRLVPAAELGKTSNKYAYFNQSTYKTLGGHINLGCTTRNWDLRIALSPIGRYNIVSKSNASVSPYTFVYETNGKIGYTLAKYDMQVSCFLRYNDRLVRFYQTYDDNGEKIVRQFIQDGYTLADLSISKQFLAKRLELLLGIQNILNIDNVPISGSAGGAHSGSSNTRPVGLGRTYLVKLSYHFKQ